MSFNRQFTAHAFLIDFNISYSYMLYAICYSYVVRSMIYNYSRGRIHNTYYIHIRGWLNLRK